MSRKTDKRVQLYFLGDEDLAEYYKKLTTFQRNYSKLVDNFNDTIYWKQLQAEPDSLYKMFLTDAPWYQIPESMVVEANKIINFRITVPFNTEIEWPCTVDYVQSMILAYKQGADITPYNRNWFPSVPVEMIGNSLNTDMEVLYTSSQFSNTGVVPLWSYWKQNGRMPITKIMGRTNLVWKVFKLQKTPFELSRFSGRASKRNVIVIDHEPECEFWRGPDYVEDVRSIGYEIHDPYQTYRELFGEYQEPIVLDPPKEEVNYTSSAAAFKADLIDDYLDSFLDDDYGPDKDQKFFDYAEKSESSSSEGEDYGGSFMFDDE